MKFEYKSSSIDVISNDILVVKNPANIVENLTVVQTNTAKTDKFRAIVERNTDNKRTYQLRYWLVNQDQKVLNLPNPIVKRADAIKLMKSLINLDNTTIYILPVKIPVAGGRFVAKATLKPNKVMPTFVLVTTTDNN